MPGASSLRSTPFLRKFRTCRLPVFILFLVLLVSLLVIRICVQHFQQSLKLSRLQGYNGELRLLTDTLQKMEERNYKINSEVTRLRSLMNRTLQRLNKTKNT